MLSNYDEVDGDKYIINYDIGRYECKIDNNVIRQLSDDPYTDIYIKFKQKDNIIEYVRKNILKELFINKKTTSFDKIAELFKVLIEKKEITYLTLEWFKFGDKELNAISTIIDKCPLKCLSNTAYIYHCHSTGTIQRFASTLRYSDIISLTYHLSGKDASMVLLALIDNTSITELDIHCCKIDDITVLSSFILQNKIVKKLYLTSTEISYYDAKIFQGALVKNDTLKYLNLDDCFLDRKGESVIASIVATNKSLKELYVEVNNDCYEIMSELSKNTTLKTFTIACGTYSGQMDGVISMIEKNRTLTSLNITGYEITTDQSIRLGQALKDNNMLKYLDLHDNYIYGPVHRYITRGCDSIESLNLTDLLKYEKDIIGVCEELKDNKVIEELYMNHVKISNKGMVAIRDLLNKCNIKTLGLHSCDFESDKVLIDIIKDDTQLEALNISYNNNDKKSIISALKHNTTLTKINLSGYKSWDSIRKTTRDLFKVNKTLASFGDIEFLDTHTIYYLKRNQKLRDNSYQLAPLIENGIDCGMLDVNSIIYKYLSVNESLNREDICNILKK